MIDQPVDRWTADGCHRLGGWWYRGRCMLEVCPGKWWGNGQEAQVLLGMLSHGRNQFVGQLEHWLAAADPAMYRTEPGGRGIVITHAVFDHGRECWYLLVVGDAMADVLGEWVPGDLPSFVDVPEAVRMRLWDAAAKGEA